MPSPRHYKASIAERAIALGATIVNDVTALLETRNGGCGGASQRGRHSSAPPWPIVGNVDRAVVSGVVAEVRGELAARRPWLRPQVSA